MIILDNGTNFIDAQNELYELRMLLEQHKDIRYIRKI